MFGFRGGDLFISDATYSAQLIARCHRPGAARHLMSVRLGLWVACGKDCLEFEKIGAMSLNCGVLGPCRPSLFWLSPLPWRVGLARWSGRSSWATAAEIEKKKYGIQRSKKRENMSISGYIFFFFVLYFLFFSIALWYLCSLRLGTWAKYCIRPHPLEYIHTHIQ